MNIPHAVVAVDNKAIALPLAGVPMGTQTIGIHCNQHDADRQAGRINELISAATQAASGKSALLAAAREALELGDE